MSILPISGGLTPNVNGGYFMKADVRSKSVVPTSSHNVIIYCLSCITMAVGLPGMVANILIIMTYFNMGILSFHRVRVGFHAMAASDLFTCFVTVVWAVVLLPNFTLFGQLTDVSKEIIITSLAWHCLAFNKTTAWITAWLAAERCFVILCPRHVHSWITRRRTVLIMAVIYLFTAGPMLLYDIGSSYEVRTSVFASNKTVHEVRLVNSTWVNLIYKVLSALYGWLYQWIPLGIIAVCTIFLAVQYKQHRSWRRLIIYEPEESKASTALKSGEALNTFPVVSTGDASSGRDTKEVNLSVTKKVTVIKPVRQDEIRIPNEENILNIVLLLALLLLVFSTPGAIIILVVLLDPTYQRGGDNYGLHNMLTFLAAFIAMFNACFKIVIYYKLDHRFRERLRKCLRLPTTAEQSNSVDRLNEF